MAKNGATAETEEREDGPDRPILDTHNAALTKLIAKGKERGFVTYDELNAALPQDQVSSEQIEDVMTMFSETGINIVDGDDNEDAVEQSRKDEKNGAVVEVETQTEEYDRTDDPVRMYLREMGSVELLSREGEIAIAKRIEAGRDTMIWGLCESPITFNAIIEWSNALNHAEMQLREILDLEAMLSKGPTPEQVESAENEDGDISEKTAGPSFKEEEDVEEVAREEDEEDSLVERRTPRPVEEEDEDNTLSLAQMEETLKPEALAKFARITDLYKKFARLQHARMEAMSAGGDFPPGDERRYQKLREQLTAEVESVQFHGAKIEYLVDQLYAYNRRLTALGGQMLRLAERHKVPRRAFLEAYMGHELDEGWAERVCGLDKKWAAFAENEAGAVDRIRIEVQNLNFNDITVWAMRQSQREPQPDRVSLGEVLDPRRPRHLVLHRDGLVDGVEGPARGDRAQGGRGARVDDDLGLTHRVSSESCDHCVGGGR